MQTPASSHPEFPTRTFATVILPLAAPRPFTYYVPESLLDRVQFGVRVEVQFGKTGASGRAGKLYAALVVEVHQQKPASHEPKPILDVLDDTPLIQPAQVKLWQWMATYYCCSIGEVMHAALPSHLKLSGEMRLALDPNYEGNMSGLSDSEYLIAEALSIQETITIEDVRDILERKNIFPIIKSLLEQKIIILQEDLLEKYQPKTIICVNLAEPYASDPALLQEAFERLGRAPRQVEALMAFIQLSKKQKFVRRNDICELIKAESSVVNAVAQKGVFSLYEREVSRIGSYEEETVDADKLSDGQLQALRQVKEQFQSRNTVLLHGVTGSGKTRLYLELIREVIANGGQALYLLPEIALTTQLTARLQRFLGDDLLVYHSRLNNNERVELWHAIRSGRPVAMGARSALFLPFKNLQLIIVDEEHDPSFKQNDPAPRYQGRDTAIYLAQLYGAKVLLGTATPSIETYFNAQNGKYGLVEISDRFGGIQMPEIVLLDARQEAKKRTMQSHFTSALLDELKAAIERGEQAILFQNRRGYAPTYRCFSCGWHSECIHCDVSLTYHKYSNLLKCHYCGYQTKLPQECPACGHRQLTLTGFGTEKIEDELKIYLPDARIGRLDLDTARSRNAHANIIQDFEERRFDIMVGTQMVTKGLDFENVGIVGILSADQLLQFPEFRAAERAFQLMVQVSGRAGRKHRRGKVLIQALNTGSPTLQDVIRHDFKGFYNREIEERRAFQYPPFTRLIRITLKHKIPEVLNKASTIFTKGLKSSLDGHFVGPAVPYVSRVRGLYLLDYLVKTSRDVRMMDQARRGIEDATVIMQSQEGFSGVRVVVDVDPA
jgi:primosomal protein N' (replication factor Y)